MSLDADVIIVGAGPTGLMLAAELALAGVDVLAIDRRPDQTVAGSRARGLHARTIEVLEQRGIADRLLAAGEPAQVQTFAGVALDLSDFPTRHPYGLALGQAHIEALLAEWVGELPARVRRSSEVVAVAQDEAAATVQLASCAGPWWACGAAILVCTPPAGSRAAPTEPGRRRPIAPAGS